MPRQDSDDPKLTKFKMLIALPTLRFCLREALEPTCKKSKMLIPPPSVTPRKTLNLEPRRALALRLRDEAISTKDRMLMSLPQRA
jgi:hypothetical protein